MKNFTKNTKILWAKKYYSAKNKKLIVTRFLTQNQTRYNGFDQRAIWCARFNLNYWKNTYILKGRVSLKKRRRPAIITQFSKNDLQIYQEIMEAALAKKGVTSEDIAELFRKRKEEIENKKKSAECLDINRCAVYYKPKIRNKKQNINFEIIAAIQKIIIESDYTIGRDKIVNYIQRLFADQRVTQNTYYIRQHVKSLGYKSRIHSKKHYKPYEHKLKMDLFPDLVNKKFKSFNYNGVWYTDVSYIRLNTKYYYLSTEIDGFNNELLGWSISNKNNTQLVIDSSNKSLKARNNQPPKIIHFDHGRQYGSDWYINLITNLNIKISMSPKGNFLANRPIEYFFATSNVKNLELMNENRWII